MCVCLKIEKGGQCKKGFSVVTEGVSNLCGYYGNVSISERYAQNVDSNVSITSMVQLKGRHTFSNDRHCYYIGIRLKVSFIHAFWDSI